MDSQTFFDILNLDDNTRLEYLQGLHDPNPETGTVETPEEIEARQQRLAEFEAAMKENETHPDLVQGGGLQCIFNCAKEYIQCRKWNPTYPGAAICDAGAQQCFTQCFLNWS